MEKRFNIIIFFAALSFAIHAIYFYPDHKPSEGVVYFLACITSIFISIIFGVLIFTNKSNGKN